MEIKVLMMVWTLVMSGNTAWNNPVAMTQTSQEVSAATCEAVKQSVETKDGIKFPVASTFVMVKCVPLTK